MDPVSLIIALLCIVVIWVILISIYITIRLLYLLEVWSKAIDILTTRQKPSARGRING